MKYAIVLVQVAFSTFEPNKHFYEKSFFLIVALFTINSAHAQKFYDAVVVTKSNDTVTGKIRLFMNAMDGLFGVADASYYGDAFTLTNDKSKSIGYFKPKNVQELYIQYPTGQRQHWINSGKSLMKIHYTGKKITWMKYYSRMLDGTPVLNDLLINANGFSYTINRLNFRKGFAKLTADKPELAQEIEDLPFDYIRFFQLIEEYDAL